MNWSDALPLLPDHQPRPDAWDRLDSNPHLLDLRADTVLRLALRQLPQHNPAPDLWTRLDAELTADETLGRALTTLPTFAPRADLWHGLENRLAANEATETNQPDARPFRVSRNTGFGEWAGQWAAAAAVLLTLLGGYWFYQRNVLPESAGETVTVAYSVEITPIPQVVMDEQTTTAQADQNLNAFITQACEQQQLACNKPAVQDLRRQLAELDQRRGQINDQVRVFGGDPDLVKVQVRIENERADVAKELVNLLNI